MKTIAPALCLAAALAGCGGDDPNSVVVYSSLDEHYSRPVLQEFEKRTGIKVLDRYDTEADKTTGLYLRLLAEKPRPRADVFWNSEVLRTVLLAREGVLAPYTPQAAADLPAAFRDPAGLWTGFAARARIIIYSTDLVPAGGAPRSIAAFGDPRFRGRAAVALPLFGTTATHAGALRAVLGKEAMEGLFRSWKENGVRVAAGNAQVRDLVVSGEAAIGLTDTDDAHEAVRAGKPVAIVFPDQEGDFQGLGRPLGTFLIPNTVGIVAGGPHPDQGRRLIEYLLSREVEETLARSGGAQIPLRPGVAPPPGLGVPKDLRKMEVDFAAAARGLEEEEPFLKELFVR
jgi:iron(III) transport system substrate-binding protein